MNRASRNDTARTQQLLTWQEALAILEKCDAKGVPIPFAVAFCTADESRKTGGQIIRYERAIWHVPGGRVLNSAAFRKAGHEPKQPRSAAQSGRRTGWTRRIQAVGTDQVRQLHLHLILDINGQPVR